MCVRRGGAAFTTCIKCVLCTAGRNARRKRVSMDDVVHGLTHTRLLLTSDPGPWEAPKSMLSAAGVRLGADFPQRVVVDLEQARLASHKAVLDVRRSEEARACLGLQPPYT